MHSHTLPKISRSPSSFLDGFAACFLFPLYYRWWTAAGMHHTRFWALCALYGLQIIAMGLHWSGVLLAALDAAEEPRERADDRPQRVPLRRGAG